MDDELRFLLTVAALGAAGGALASCGSSGGGDGHTVAGPRVVCGASGADGRYCQDVATEQACDVDRSEPYALATCGRSCAPVEVARFCDGSPGGTYLWSPAPGYWDDLAFGAAYGSGGRCSVPTAYRLLALEAATPASNGSTTQVRSCPDDPSVLPGPWLTVAQAVGRRWYRGTEASLPPAPPAPAP